MFGITFQDLALIEILFDWWWQAFSIMQIGPMSKTSHVQYSLAIKRRHSFEGAFKQQLYFALSLFKDRYEILVPKSGSSYSLTETGFHLFDFGVKYDPDTLLTGFVRFTQKDYYHYQSFPDWQE